MEKSRSESLGSARVAEAGTKWMSEWVRLGVAEVRIALERYECWLTKIS